MHIDQEASVPVAPRLRQLSGQRMSPQQAAQHTGSAKQHKEHQINGNGAQQGQLQEPTTLPSRDRESMQFQSMEGRHQAGSGLLALSAEDKARIGNLIKVLAKERRDKEDLREKLGQQACRVQDLEREREVSQRKEAELMARVTRSVDLLRTCQSEALSRKQGRFGDADVDETSEEAEAIRPSPELPPLPQLRLLQTQAKDAKESEDGISSSLRGLRGLRFAEPAPSEAVESARPPANLEKQVFALKPPQLSVLQRYLSIQDGGKLETSGSPNQSCGERPHENTSDVAVQTAGAALPSERAASMSPTQIRRVRDSMASPGRRSKAMYEEEGYQRLRLGHRHCRWAQKSQTAAPAKAPSVKVDASCSSAPSRQSSETRGRIRNASAESRLTRTLDVPSEPLLGSPLATSSARQSIRSSRGMNFDSINQWPAPLRLESCYAPNMFDVIDSLESGSRVASIQEKASPPSSISEELRRLQRELVSIQHKISQGSAWGSSEERAFKTEAWGEEFPAAWEAEILPNFSLEHWKPPQQTEESQELSQEIDDVLHLLQSVRSKGEASVVS